MEAPNSYTICATESPTHHSYNPLHRPEILDIALVNLFHGEYVLTNHNKLTSDHNPIVMTISDSPITSRPPAAKKKINWKKFEQEIILTPTNLSSNLTLIDIDNEISSITTTIQSAIEKCSSSINPTQIKDSLTPEIHLEINTKRALRKDWQCTRDPAVKSMPISQIAYVRLLLKKHRQN